MKKSLYDENAILLDPVTHRRTGPFPFGGGGGGHNNYCPNFSSLPEKSNMFGQCIFALHGGGGGGKASSSF